MTDRGPWEPGPTLIGPFGGEHPPLPPDAPRWRRIRRGIFRFFNEAGYNLMGGW